MDSPDSQPQDAREQPWKAWWPPRRDADDLEAGDKLLPWNTWQFNPEDPSAKPWGQWLEMAVKEKIVEMPMSNGQGGG